MKANQEPINKSGKLHWYAVAFADPNYRDYAIIAPTPQHAQSLAARLGGVRVKQNSAEPVTILPRKLVKCS